MSEFTTYDLHECLTHKDHGGISPDQIKRVVAARGESGREYADWTGAFILELLDGRFALLWGWSDSSGWG